MEETTIGKDKFRFLPGRIMADGKCAYTETDGHSGRDHTMVL